VSGGHVLAAADSPEALDCGAVRAVNAASVLAYAVICAVCLLRILAAEATVARALSAIAGMAAMFVLHRWIAAHAGRDAGVPAWRLIAALLAQAAIVFVPLPFLGGGWLDLAGLLAGGVLVASRGRWAWPAFAAVSAGVAATAALWFGLPHGVTASGAAAALTGALTYLFGVLVVAMAGAVAASRRIVRMEVIKERIRFARDLHDLLGYSLSAVTLKAELAARLVGRDPAPAKRELSEIIRISRQASADVRTVANSYRELSLEHEAHSARSILAAADVEAAIDLDCGEIPQPVQTVLATVLREGVTNVLRHSAATNCAITVRQAGSRVSMEIVNDGAPEPEPALQADGSGMRNLAARVLGLRGELATRFDEDRFHLRASVPL
jgi:two-component system sensor histidine kinase DesK